MPTVSFVTTCKGRLHHLRETLPLLHAQGDGEIVVVDYGCPDHTSEWVAMHYPEVRTVRVDDDAGFCLARARNLGAGAAQGEWLCFLDADIRVMPGFVAWMQDRLHEACFYRVDLSERLHRRETWGTVICSREAHLAAGGYDEVIREWGGEDDDFYDRLLLAGYSERSFPSQFVDPITHDDAERFRFQSIQSKFLNICISSLYREAKRLLLTVQKKRGDLPYELRTALMEQSRNRVMAWESQGRPSDALAAFRVEYGSPLPEGCGLVARCAFELSIARVAAGHGG